MHTYVCGIYACMYKTCAHSKYTSPLISMRSLICPIYQPGDEIHRKISSGEHEKHGLTGF